ncbi:hypothetical protein B0H21DRAFT_455533 [Amylocystis lapponica]|nr:hypothetical protein B0H21DRAFT_455533 [Amylocystis lapponica]
MGAGAEGRRLALDPRGKRTRRTECGLNAGYKRKGDSGADQRRRLAQGKRRDKRKCSGVEARRVDVLPVACRATCVREVAQSGQAATDGRTRTEQRHFCRQRCIARNICQSRTLTSFPLDGSGPNAANSEYFLRGAAFVGADDRSAAGGAICVGGDWIDDVDDAGGVGRPCACAVVDRVRPRCSRMASSIERVSLTRGEDEASADVCSRARS